MLNCHTLREPAFMIVTNCIGEVNLLQSAAIDEIGAFEISRVELNIFKYDVLKYNAFKVYFTEIGIGYRTVSER